MLEKSLGQRSGVPGRAIRLEEDRLGYLSEASQKNLGMPVYRKPWPKIYGQCLIGMIVFKVLNLISEISYITRPV